MKIRAWPDCEFRHCIDVFLDRRKVADACQADEELGEVWIQVRDSEGHLVPEFWAPVGAFTWQGAQVEKLRGSVEIVVTPEQGYTEEQMREAINKSGCQIFARVVEQPLPIANSLPACWDLVKIDIEKRDTIGQQRYGTRLQPHNGRDALWDTYEELLDAIVYIRQAIYERDGK